MLEPQVWPGVICQPFAFGKAKADWKGAEELKDKLDKLLREKRGSGLTITRIARILRDADETLADLWDMGF